MRRLLSTVLDVLRENTRAWMRHVECIFPRVMTAREHHALRAFGVLLLAIAALWPRSHAAHHDNAVARHAIRGQYTTAAARPSAGELPRPRTLSSQIDDAAPVETRLVVDDADESQLRN
jgi:hypothetical protein